MNATASGGLLFPSTRLPEDDEFDPGEFKFKIVHTPGHTPESVSFMVEERGQPRAIFTGGALLLGGAARVHVLGSKIAPFLARWLHNAIHEKLLKLTDDVDVYPTHGCSLWRREHTNHDCQETADQPFLPPRLKKPVL